MQESPARDEQAQRNDIVLERRRPATPPLDPSTPEGEEASGSSGQAIAKSLVEAAVAAMNKGKAAGAL